MKVFRFDNVEVGHHMYLWLFVQATDHRAAWEALGEKLRDMGHTWVNVYDPLARPKWRIPVYVGTRV